MSTNHGNGFVDNYRTTASFCSDAEADLQVQYGTKLQRNLRWVVACMAAATILALANRFVGETVREWMNLPAIGVTLLAGYLLFGFDQLVNTGYDCNSKQCSTGEERLLWKVKQSLRRSVSGDLLCFGLAQAALFLLNPRWLAVLLTLICATVVARCCYVIHDHATWLVWRHERFTGVIHDWE